MADVNGGTFGLPNDVRYFVHKRIGRGLRSFVGSGFNPLAGIGGFIAPPEQPRVRRAPPRTTVARPSFRGAAGKELGRTLKLQNPAGVPTGFGAVPKGQACPPGAIRVPGSQACFAPLGPAKSFISDLFPPSGVRIPSFGASGVGDAVMGRYGAALTPGSRIIDRAVCLRGMVVGNDGLCYNRSQIKNSERMWPRGRRPLLTGGDMRAISIAARAASRLTRTAVRLQDIGLIKKPVTRRPRKKKG